MVLFYEQRVFSELSLSPANYYYISLVRIGPEWDQSDLIDKQDVFKRSMCFLTLVTLPIWRGSGYTYSVSKKWSQPRLVGISKYVFTVAFNTSTVSTVKLLFSLTVPWFYPLIYTQLTAGGTGYASYFHLLLQKWKHIGELAPPNGNMLYIFYIFKLMHIICMVECVSYRFIAFYFQTSCISTLLCPVLWFWSCLFKHFSFDLHLPAMQETWVRSLGREDPLEKEMATYSSILAWRIPWTEEPGGLQSTGSQRVRHDFTSTLISPDSVLDFVSTGH